MQSKISLFLLLFLYALNSTSQQPYKEIESINQNGIPITCFFQDDQQQIWVCTQEGMYIYDGAKMQRNHSWVSNAFVEGSIRCSYKMDSVNYYIGCENGLYELNLKTYTFDLVPETLGLDVRAISLVDSNSLLLGTMNGLMKFDLKEKSIRKIRDVHSFPVVSISLNNDKTIAYISSNNGFFEYDISTEKYTFVSLPIISEKSSLIHAMNYDKLNNCLWLGVEKKLYQYHLDKKTFDYKPISSEYTINTIMVDHSGYIWIGTDKGIRLYNGATGLQEYTDQLARSSNQVVWAIFEDIKSNIWIGTESGLFLYKNSPFVQTLSWRNLIQSDEWNRLTCLYKDSKGNFWFGGANGLGRLSPGKQFVDWYKTDDSRFHISHNRICCIYEDQEGVLWVGTNESINRYEYQKGKFIHYSIMDSTMMRSTDWCHSITEDSDGFLWITSFLGGVFKVNKENLQKSNNKIYLAEDNYYQHDGKNGLSSNRVQKSICDKEGNIWVSTFGNGLNKIDNKANSVVVFSTNHDNRELSNNNISSLFCDSSGFIWVGMPGALNKIDPQTNEVISIDNAQFKTKDILDIVEKDNYLWLIVSDGLYALNKHTNGITFMQLEDQRFSCSYLDELSGDIYIGGINQCISFAPERILDDNKESCPIIFTALFINNEPVQVGEKYNENKILTNSLSYTNEIKLAHDQNNISFELTDVRYNQIIKTQYFYKLDEFDKAWSILDMNTNKISYHNLPPGKYNLIVQQADEKGNPITEQQMTFRISPPWYLTTSAKVIYVASFLVLFVWIINYFRVKNKLKIERVEKEKLLELSAMKMEFLSNISHEIKTPLSLIISPVNKLLTSIKNENNKKTLQTVQQNAMRLSSLVNQMIDAKNIEFSQDSLLKSPLDIVEFSKSVSNIYLNSFQAKGVELKFETNVDQLYIDVDILKFESILNNLISNAYKFTKDGDSVLVKINYQDQNLENPNLQITVSDTGIGIPPNDIPYIFNRFYQSETNSYMNKDGSGIGLSMVKKYVEMHDGAVKVESEQQKGTSIILDLPIIKHEKNIFNIDSKKNEYEISDINILIVEDNIEIARFIKENLKNINCYIAQNGNSGLEAAKKHHPDLIISDVMMPIMDGIEMSRLLKQNITTATIPIILLTAKDDEQTENLAYSVGVDAFISKPFDINQIALRIEQIRKNKTLLINKIRQSKIIEGKGLESVTESEDEKLLKKITQIIEEHISDSDLNVQKLTSISGIGDKKIYRRIKLLTGQTTVEYIKTIRLKKAAALLSQHKFSIGEVMHMVGFSNPSYFSKCFSEKYGKTPKQYMESSI